MLMRKVSGNLIQVAVRSSGRMVGYTEINAVPNFPPAAFLRIIAP